MDIQEQIDNLLLEINKALQASDLPDGYYIDVKIFKDDYSDRWEIHGIKPEVLQ